VVVADPSDNAGGGAPSDNTNVIHRLLARAHFRQHRPRHRASVLIPMD